MQCIDEHPSLALQRLSVSAGDHQLLRLAVFQVLSKHRDIEELMAERGVIVTYETIRAWCYKFGKDYAKRIRARRGRLGDTWHLDEVYLKIDGRLRYLWRAVDQDGSA
jgi:putative transposase